MQGNLLGLKHGQRHTKLYEVWLTMKQRCSNPKTESYRLYGGEGKSVCDEWLNDFQAFYTWSMAHGYSEGLSIERIDGNKGYSPDNCRWATQIEQANNTRRNHFITYADETHTIAEWARIRNLTYPALMHRIKRGWNVEKALCTPLKK